MAIEKTGNDLVVIASAPAEMAEGQTALIERVKGLESEAAIDLADAEKLVQQCENSNLAIEPPKRLLVRAKSRALYLSKVREALEAGYAIVPSFLGTTIAVRVKNKKPNSRSHTTGHSNWLPTVPNVPAEVLPSGEGRYVNPQPLVDGDVFPEKDANGKVIRYESFAYARAFNEEIGLPVEFLKPTIIEMTNKGMARKIFDEVAIIDGNIPDGRGGRGKPDPLVVGTIIDRANRKRMSFLIAWFVDTKTF